MSVVYLNDGISFNFSWLVLLPRTIHAREQATSTYKTYVSQMSIVISHLLLSNIHRHQYTACLISIPWTQV